MAGAGEGRVTAEERAQRLAERLADYYVAADGRRTLAPTEMSRVWIAHAAAEIQAATDETRLDGLCSCPCTRVEPCSPACSCASSVQSGGCRRCCRYGSEDQRQAAAEAIAADAASALAAEVLRTSDALERARATIESAPEGPWAEAEWDRVIAAEHVRFAAEQAHDAAVRAWRAGKERA